MCLNIAAQSSPVQRPSVTATPRTKLVKLFWGERGEGIVEDAVVGPAAAVATNQTASEPLHPPIGHGTTAFCSAE